MNTYDCQPAPPPLAKRSREAKPKLAGPVKLRKISPFSFAWNGSIDCPNANLSMALSVLVTVPFAVPHGTLANIEKARNRNVYIDFVVSVKKEVLFVLKYHLHDDHGHGKCHVHEAATKGKAAQKTTLQWNGASADMSIAELFTHAKTAMALTAEYHPLLETGRRT